MPAPGEVVDLLILVHHLHHLHGADTPHHVPITGAGFVIIIVAVIESLESGTLEYASNASVRNLAQHPVTQ